MKRYIYILVFACALMGTVSCQQKDKTARTTARAMVSTTDDIHASEATDTSLASKGIIVSEHDVPVYSMVSEVIKQRNIKEGVRVSKGQVLFVLDQTMHQSEIDKTVREIEQAKFQYDNILVGQGYDLSKPQSIPARIRNIARTRSSLNLYEQNLKQQKLMSAYYTITAPVSGVVTDLKAYQYDYAEKGKELCHIIDTENLNVLFSVLENELGNFQKGAVVKFTTLAFPDDLYTATVTQISPKVDENGMVRIKAHVKQENSLHALTVGMTAIIRD